MSEHGVLSRAHEILKTVFKCLRDKELLSVTRVKTVVREKNDNEHGCILRDSVVHRPARLLADLGVEGINKDQCAAGAANTSFLWPLGPRSENKK